MPRRLVCVLALAALTALCAAPAASAYPGDLDPSFNSTGYAITAFPSGWASAEDVAIQADGKVVAVGTSALGASRQFAVARYNADGTLDTSFGGTGLVTTSIGVAESWANAVAIQPDGKIVVGGRAAVSIGPPPQTVTGFGLVRYNADGTPDSSFGTGGKVTTYVAGGGEFCPGVQVSAVAIHGGLIYAGGGGPCSRRGTFPYVARYGSNGGLDTTYSGDGIATDHSVGNSVDAMMITSDAKAVVVGISPGGDPQTSTVVRFAADGTLDTGFGTGGAVGRVERLRAITPVGGGKFVVLGIPQDNANLRLSRYDAGGVIDTSFGTGGTVNTPVPDVLSIDSSGLVTDSDGRLVASSTAFVRDPATSEAVANIALHRWSADGVHDDHFGTDGRVLTPLADGAHARALAIQPDGKLVTAGCAPCRAGEPFSFAVARFLGGTAANRVPTASFAFTPAAPFQGDTVTFDATASDDPDGPIAGYRWDLDGSGDYETDTGASPYATASFTTVGTHTVGLQVLDADGATATTTRSVTVSGYGGSGPPGPPPGPPGPPPGPPSPPPGPPGPPDAPSLTINGGSRYTTTPNVILDIVAPGATTVEVSNHADFDDATSFAVAPNGLYRWRLDSSGVERLPRTVYVRVGTHVVTDTIVVDETPPRLLPPVKTPTAVRISASDLTSGVRGVQVTTNRSRPGKVRGYKRKIPFRAGSRAVYVRVLDGAGNFSRWRRAASR